MIILCTDDVSDCSGGNGRKSVLKIYKKSVSFTLNPAGNAWICCSLFVYVVVFSSVSACLSAELIIGEAECKSFNSLLGLCWD